MRRDVGGMVRPRVENFLGFFSNQSGMDTGGETA